MKFETDSMRSIVLLATASFTGLIAQPALATQYMTLEQAQRLMFAEATEFRAMPLQLSNEQMQKVQTVAGLVPRSVNWNVFAAYKGEQLLGHFITDEVIGKYELISYAVALSPQAVVQQIEILSYRESHGFEIRSPAWRKQFVGKSAEAGIRVGDGISNISGATLSCTHVTDGVRRIAAIAQVALKI